MRQNMTALPRFRRMAALLIFITMLAGLVHVSTAAPDEPLLVGGSDNLTYLPIISVPRGFEANPIAGTFGSITHITHAGDDRLFIGQRDGRVHILYPDGQQSTFLDISSRVIDDGTEQGFFAIAFHPDYANNGYFFVSYTGSRYNQGDFWLFVSRFQVTGDPNVADPNSEERVLQVQMTSVLHNGGGLVFNPIDGKLYVGVGEDQGLLIAQDLGSTKGKIVRLDVDAFPAVTTEKIAMGLRNPWRIDVDPISGTLWIADVGDDSWEEINVMSTDSDAIPNFGWPCMEGNDVILNSSNCQSPSSYAAPFYAYAHNPACAIVGGYFFRNSLGEPRYLFGDVCTRNVFVLAYKNSTWQAENVGQLPSEMGLLTTFGVDNEGTYYAGGFPNALYELYIPPN